jgi:hypothetical protein
VPEIDVQALDLLDQEQNRTPGGPHLVAAVVQQTLAPFPQSLQLVFVEAIRSESLQRLFVQRLFIRVGCL